MNIIQFILIFLLPIIHLLTINRNSNRKLKTWSLIWSFYCLFLFSLLYLVYQQDKGFQLLYIYKWIEFTQLNWGSILLGIDGYSLFFIGLSILLTPIIIMISWDNIKFLLKEFILCIYLTLILLIILFSLLEIISFYILFEVILIPIFIIIGIWGSRKQKIQASFYFFLYTLAGSFLMLLSIFKLYNTIGVTDFTYLLIIDQYNKLEYWLFIGFFISLSIKIPMFPFHLWLPKAHVEAPISGSLLLAGILLKLGGYGMIRFILPLFPKGSNFYSSFIIILSIIAIIYGALSTLKQNDIKKLIAYSSVSHMGIVTIAIFSFSPEGVISSILMMLAHGLISSGMFMSASMLYVRHHSRAIKYYKGLTSSMPLFSSLNLIFILSNMSFPLSFNFIAEILSIKAVTNFSFSAALFVCIGCFITTIYTLFLYNRLFFGKFSSYLKFSRDIVRQEFYNFIPLITLTVVLGILPNILLFNIYFSTYLLISL